MKGKCVLSSNSEGAKYAEGYEKLPHHRWPSLLHPLTVWVNKLKSEVVFFLQVLITLTEIMWLLRSTAFGPGWEIKKMDDICCWEVLIFWSQFANV